MTPTLPTSLHLWYTYDYPLEFDRPRVLAELEEDCRGSPQPGRDVVHVGKGRGDSHEPGRTLGSLQTGYYSLQHVASAWYTAVIHNLNFCFLVPSF